MKLYKKICVLIGTIFILLLMIKLQTYSKKTQYAGIEEKQQISSNQQINLTIPIEWVVSGVNESISTYAVIEELTDKSTSGTGSDGVGTYSSSYNLPEIQLSEGTTTQNATWTSDYTIPVTPSRDDDYYLDFYLEAIYDVTMYSKGINFSGSYEVQCTYDESSDTWNVSKIIDSNTEEEVEKIQFTYSKSYIFKQIPVSQIIEIPDGAEIGADYVIYYNMTQTKKDGVEVTDQSDEITVSVGGTVIDTGTTGTNGKYTTSTENNNTGIRFEATEDADGTYEFSVSETIDVDSDTKGTMYTTDTTYTIQIVVTKGSKEITMTVTNSDGEKVAENMEFTNCYVENVESGLSIEQITTGSGADTTLRFPVKVKITYPTYTGTDASTYVNSIRSNIRTAASDAVYATDINSDTFIFYLASSETLEFGTLPAGTTYSVQEILEETTDITYDSQYASYDCGNGQGINGKENSGVVSSDVDNTVTLTAEMYTVTPAGIIINNLPYIVLIIISGVCLLIINKKRKSHRWN